MTSVFAHQRETVWPFRYEVSLLCETIAGGVPSDPRVAEGYLKSKLGDKDDQIRQMVAETMVERGVGLEEAAQIVDDLKHCIGFRRDDRGLYIGNYQLQAALHEAAMVAANTGKIATSGWGTPDNKSYLKGIKGWFKEHVVVPEPRIYLGVSSPSGYHQSFPKSKQYGSSIQYAEYVENAKLDFTVVTDFAFSDAQWAAIWLTGELQGLGASRSQGFGRYEVVRWERA